MNEVDKQRQLIETEQLIGFFTSQLSMNHMQNMLLQAALENFLNKLEILEGGRFLQLELNFEGEPDNVVNLF